MKIKLHGKIWEYREVPNLGGRGDIDPPHQEGKQVRILSNLDGEEELEVILHELLHGCAWILTEDWVETTAEDIAKILWRLGYRKRKKEEKAE